MAAATASFACRDASSIAAFDGAGFVALSVLLGAPFAAAVTGGVNVFWLTAKGTAGVTRAFFGADGVGFAEA